MRKRAIKRTALAVFCLCVCGLWVRSYWWGDDLGVNTSPPGPPVANWGGIPVVGNPTGDFYGITSCRGSFYIVRLTTFDSQTLRTGWSSAQVESPDTSLGTNAQLHIAGFSFNWVSGGTMTFLGIPFWLALAACAIPTIARRRRAHRMRKQGHCHRCGYDLRATPDRCPECGNVPD